MGCNDILKGSLQLLKVQIHSNERKLLVIDFAALVSGLRRKDGFGHMLGVMPYLIRHPVLLFILSCDF